MPKFSVSDYYRMYKARGIRLPVQYFFQNHLFDLRHGTDTHFRLEKKDYLEHPAGFESGVLYMSSVTKEVKRALRIIEKNTGGLFSHYQFFDLGCGKGKALLIYAMTYGDKALHQAFGLEYYPPLAAIGESNLGTLRLNEKALVLNADARQFTKYITSNKLIVYLYNPFGADILSTISDSCRKQDVFVIYTDPEHRDTLISHGFSPVNSKTGRYPNRNTEIFFREKE